MGLVSFESTLDKQAGILAYHTIASALLNELIKRDFSDDELERLENHITQALGECISDSANKEPETTARARELSPAIYKMIKKGVVKNE